MNIYLHHPIQLSLHSDSLFERLYADDQDKLIELIKILTHRGQSVTLTCDDGFKSVLNIVDLISEYNVKLIIFPIAGILAGKDEAIPYEINLMRYLDQELTVKFENTCYKCATLKEKINAYTIIHSKLKYSALGDKFRFINSLYSSNPGMQSLSNFNDYLDVNDLNSLAMNQYIAIGSHGLYHCSHNTLGSLGKIKSLLFSKHIIQKSLGKPIDAFAAPYGSFTKNLVIMSKLCGYKYFYTTESMTNPFPSTISRIDLNSAYNSILSYSN